MRGLPEGTRLTKDGVDRYAWFDKEKPCGEQRRTIHLGQGFDTVSERRTVNLSDWELEIHKWRIIFE
jgi:hypothetical protein